MTLADAGFSGPQYYDECLGPLWLEPYAVDLAQRTPASPPGDVLEIACGTGIVTRRLRERLDPAVKLVASDLSVPMLDYARRKLAALPGIDWLPADAQNLPFDDARFAVVVCGFGLMFPPDRQAALRQVRRVLAPGGVLLFNVWDRIEHNPHAQANAQVVEGLFPGDAQMRFSTPYDMCEPALLQHLLDGAGLRATQIEVKRVDFDDVDPRDIATGQIRGTPRSALIEQRGVALDGVIDQVTAALARAGGNPYRGHAQAVIVHAQAV